MILSDTKFFRVKIVMFFFNVSRQPKFKFGQYQEIEKKMIQLPCLLNSEKKRCRFVTAMTKRCRPVRRELYVTCGWLCFVMSDRHRLGQDLFYLFLLSTMVGLGISSIFPDGDVHTTSIIPRRDQKKQRRKSLKSLNTSPKPKVLLNIVQKNVTCPRKCVAMFFCV